jgi:hypothetical protein
MADERKDDRFSGPTQSQGGRRPDRADDQSGQPARDPAAGAKSPLEDHDWKDQSQGPSHPLDDQGNKRG